MKKFKFKIDGTSYSVNVKSIEGTQAEIEVNGTNYSVELEEEVNPLKTPILVRKEVGSNPGENRISPKEASVIKSGKPGSNNLKAPLPGSIIRILVKSGDVIKKGDVLLVMESMKMENNILAEKDVVVKSIFIQEGNSVMQDDVLIDFE
jgi:glutaconyl-CoA/methylmalonyl-CoA decarboxylase subunit gamma